MKSTDPMEIEKFPFEEYMEKPQWTKNEEPEDTIYDPPEMGNGYECQYTEQIRRLDEEIRAFGYQTPVLEDQEEPSFLLFNRAFIVEVERMMRILSVSGALIYTIEDLEDIREMPEPFCAAVTDQIQSFEEPEDVAVLTVYKNRDELKKAIAELPDELIYMVRMREWMAAYDKWNSCFYMSDPFTWFYDDIDLRECLERFWRDIVKEVDDWMKDQNAPGCLIVHVELPHKKVGYCIGASLNFEEQCVEMKNLPLKGLTAKLRKDENEPEGCTIDDFYPDHSDIY